MKLRQIVSMNLLLASALGFAGAASAQETPPTSDQAKQEMNEQKTDPLMMQGSSGGEWSTIKGHDKGYLTKDDAQPNSWLAHNFANCDKDRDGKITEKEYMKCQSH
ncbi:MAG TPA: hypothetical protein VKB52_17055 [Rhodanobacteraceae bacterium]|nr:hypothetical protein [Rhodanobacteraceae bacterium]